jgi:hypothetical protein
MLCTFLYWRKFEAEPVNVPDYPVSFQLAYRATDILCLLYLLLMQLVPRIILFPAFNGI